MYLAEYMPQVIDEPGKQCRFCTSLRFCCLQRDEHFQLITGELVFAGIRCLSVEIKLDNIFCNTVTLGTRSVLVWDVDINNE